MGGGWVTTRIFPSGGSIRYATAFSVTTAVRAPTTVGTLSSNTILSGGS